jgi:hypothetical protein
MICPRERELVEIYGSVLDSKQKLGEGSFEDLLLGHLGNTKAIFS